MTKGLEIQYTSKASLRPKFSQPLEILDDLFQGKKYENQGKSTCQRL